MRRAPCQIAAVVLAACALGVGAAPAGAAGTYCSPTGDYCTSARAEHDGVVRIRLPGSNVFGAPLTFKRG